MPKFPEVAAFLGETLDLPIGGQVYCIPAVDGETGVRLVARFTDASAKADAGDGDEEVDDISEIALYQECLGPVYAQLLAAPNVKWPMIKAAALTALAWHVHGEGVALAVWERGGFPKRALTSTETTEPPVIQGEVLSTPQPASESGTTPTPSKARRSRGRTSSTAGT